jgi:UDP-2,4-diacetamido-2,4,6-trideoxy-beta-L-altropyranose hydrolase
VSQPVVTFLADGGQNVGLGHLNRCLGLALALRDKGVEPLFLEDDTHELRAFADQNELSLRTCRASDAILASSDAIALVIDHYQVDLNDIMHTGGDKRPLIVVFDDEGRRPIEADIIVNGSPAALELDYRHYGSRKWLLGPKFQVIRRDLSGYQSRDRQGMPRNLFVAIGGGDPLGIAPVLLRFLEDRICERWPDLEANFILGPFTQALRPPNSPNLKILKNPPNMAALIGSADLAITAGGQTLFECLRCGVPLIPLVLADHQWPNIKTLIKSGMVLPGAAISDPDWQQRLESQLGALITQRFVRKRLSQKGLGLIDGCGAERIAAAVLEACPTNQVV